jgi:uncharacterized protein
MRTKRVPSSIHVLIRLFRLGRELHPRLTARDLKNRAAILGLWISSLRELRAWYGISDNPKLASALKQYPLMHGAVYWPYINHSWSMERRLTTIDQHYRLLEGRASVIGLATRQEVELTKLDEHYPGMRLVLDKAIWFLREGEIVLNLFLRDQRFYSIAFTLNAEAGQLVAYVGALQGSASEDALQVYREMTHALHGMRPRDFLVVALKLLCKEFRVAKIYAVSADARQHNSPYFGDSHKEKVLVNYDEVWAEHGGTRLDNGFFDIPVPVKYRDVSDIPTRKRAAYRRRYQMLDKVALDIEAVCSLHDTTRLPSPALVV